MPNLNAQIEAAMQATVTALDTSAHDPQYGSVTDLLAKATDMIRDAYRIAEHPWLTRMPTLTAGNLEHVHALRLGTRLGALCDAEADPMERVVYSQSVPTCPECIAALKGKSRIARE